MSSILQSENTTTSSDSLRQNTEHQLYDTGLFQEQGGRQEHPTSMMGQSLFGFENFDMNEIIPFSDNNEIKPQLNSAEQVPSQFAPGIAGNSHRQSYSSPSQNLMGGGDSPMLHLSPPTSTPSNKGTDLNMPLSASPMFPMFGNDNMLAPNNKTSPNFPAMNCNGFSLYDQQMTPPYSPPQNVVGISVDGSMRTSPSMQYRRGSGASPMLSLQQAPQQMQPFMPYDAMNKYPMVPFGMFPHGVHKRKGLSLQELEALFHAATSHPSPTRSKRDVAILCLIIDLHLSSGTITRLTFKNVATVMALINEGKEEYSGHCIEITNQSSMITNRLQCHPFTAWALKNWIQELLTNYQWSTEEDLPVFVNSQPLYNSETGEKSLRKTSLKRDAISKVFQSIKQRSGINCHKSIVSASNLQPLNGVYTEWIRAFQMEWSEREEH